MASIQKAVNALGSTVATATLGAAIREEAEADKKLKQAQEAKLNEAKVSKLEAETKKAEAQTTNTEARTRQTILKTHDVAAAQKELYKESGGSDATWSEAIKEFRASQLTDSKASEQAVQRAETTGRDVTKQKQNLQERLRQKRKKVKRNG